MSVQELEAYHDLKAKPFYKDAKLIGKADSYPIGFNEAYVYELQLLKSNKGEEFICIDLPNSKHKKVKTIEEVIDFFGINMVSKELFADCGIDAAIQLSTLNDGQGEEFELKGYRNSPDYRFIGELKWMGPTQKKVLNELQVQGKAKTEVYQLNTGEYIKAIQKNHYYYLVEKIDVIEVKKYLNNKQ